MQLVGSCIFLSDVFCHSVRSVPRLLGPDICLACHWLQLSSQIQGKSQIQESQSYEAFSLWTCCPALPLLRCMCKRRLVMLLCYRTKSGGGGGGDDEEEEEDE